MARLAAAFAPLLATPVLGFAIAEGHLDLGGGEKDLIWLLPWTIWSLLYGGLSMVLWWRGRPPLRTAAWSALGGLAGVILLGVLLALFGQLGIGGV